MTHTEAAAALGLHKRSVLRLLGQGRFPNASKQGRGWHIPAADVEAYAKLLTARGYGTQGRANKAARLKAELVGLEERG